MYVCVPDRAWEVMDMSEILLQGEMLEKRFTIQKALFTGKVVKEFTAVDGVSLELHRGETLGVLGESGSGKSTTGEILGDLQRPTSGCVLYKGKDIRSLSTEEYRIFRRNVQYIFQDPKGSMNPNARIESVLSEPLLTLGIEKDAKKRAQRAKAMCNMVGLEESVLQKYPSEISGGQCQRVAIGRALITEPEIIVCDEVVSALDVSVQAQILNLLNELQKRLQVSYLFISHDIGVVNYMADRIAVMFHGKLIEQGTAKEVLTHPKQIYTQQLLNSSFARRVPCQDESSLNMR